MSDHVTSGPAAPPRDDGPLTRIPALRGLMVIAVLGFLGFFLTLSSLPLWTVQRGTSEALAGLPTTVMLVVTVLAQLLVPALTHRLGRPLVLAIGLVALGLPTPLLLLDGGLTPLLLASAVRGVGFAILTVTMPLVATDVSPAHRHGAAIGLYGLAIAIPQLAAVPAGVALTEAGHFGWVAWLAATPLLALPAVGMLRQSREHRDTLPRPSRPPVGAVIGITVVLFAMTLAGGGIGAILPVQRGGVVATVALLLFGLASAAVRWSIGLVADRRGTHGLITGAVLLGVLGIGVLATGVALDGAPGDVLVLLGAVLAGSAYGAVQNLTLLIGFRLAGPDRRDGASAVWNASFDLGTAIGALLVGWIAAGADLTVALLVCAGLVALTLVPGLRAQRRVAQIS